jgi:membrane-bound ClpP family serine protease
MNMEWLIVLSLIGVGLLLLVIEVILIPGTSIAGFIGFGMMIGGIVMSFKYFGDQTAWVIAGSTAVVSGAVFFWTFHTKPWKQFALKSTISSRVNEGIFEGLQVGSEGLSVSMLRPRGNAEFGNKIVEVSSLGNFVEAGTKIKIVKISSSQIFIEPLN